MSITATTPPAPAPVPAPAPKPAPAPTLTRLQVASQPLVKVTDTPSNRSWQFGSIPNFTAHNLRDGAKTLAVVDKPLLKVEYVRGYDNALRVAQARVAASVSPFKGGESARHGQAIIDAGRGAYWVTALGMTDARHTKYMMAWVDAFPGRPQPPKVERLSPAVTAVVGANTIIRF